MHNHFHRNRKALSSLAIILLLLISAIIGGLISYLWVTGYYISLTQKVPGEDIAVITNLSFNPQDATVFNATVLNPSYSPYPIINVTGIAITGENENTLHYVLAITPSLPFSLSRGTNQTFTCTSNWAQYVNQTVTVSAFVQTGSGSTSKTKQPLPYTALNVTNVEFNSIIGVNNFTITLRNSPMSATYMNITNIILPEFTPPINFTALLQPSLPITLFPNQSETLSCKYNWLTESEIGGSFGWLNVTTLQGYDASYAVQVPKLAALIQPIKFSPADTTHLNITVQNQVSTNTYLNVTRIRLLVNGAAMNATTTPPLSPSTNGVPRNQNATFLCNWNWTNYRNTNVVATVYMLQGFNVSTQFTPPAEKLSVTNAVFSDTQHILVTLQNSQYSTKPANVTMIQIQSTKNYNFTSTVYPSLPLLVGIGNTTMLSIPWNWTSYTNTPIDILVYYYIHTSENSTYYALTTPSSISNYQVYLSVAGALPSGPFNEANQGHFFVNVTNNASQINANVTRIIVLLENGTETPNTITSEIVPINSTRTFTCNWNWSTYQNKSIVIIVYSNNEPETIYVTETP